ncbi:MAG: S8 family serine peptidase [Flavobacteriales bacterium]|nr:S8 family serine peptidase [Flavobacteriales bacterium]
MLLVCLIALAGFAKDGKIFTYGPEGKNYFTQAEDRILIQFLDGTSFEEKAVILSKYAGTQKLNSDDVLPAPDVTIARTTGLTAEEVGALLIALNQNPKVVYANPFVIYSDGTYQGIQNRIIVRLKSNKDVTMMNNLAKGFNLNVVEQNEFDQQMFVLQTTKQSNGNALEIANKLHESGAFEYAEPDFLLLLKRFNTNDPNLGYQWSLNNTGSSIQYNGTPGADMNVFPAWATTTGSSTIKVAVVDEGVDLNHPDLQANLLGGYDATGQGSGGGPSGDDAHGTACAGIIAAAGNNNLGVAGVAYNCKIIPVRIAYGQGTSWVTSNTWIGNALNWAWQTAGADVLSNSWGGGSSSSTINNAISGAVTSGRGGLGAPVLFAAGNDNGANSYPATVTNTISVIAMSMCYERKNPSSCDGENWWGSNYGSGADIAAPGVKIATTDISGSAGYASGDYTGTFNGTSSATPNAAGVMALILSANPNLTQTQARYALESTCRKVGSYTYNSGVSGQPNGTWSNDLGYGLVDAYSAVLSVSPQVADDAGISSISSPSGTICATSATPSLTLNNFGSNTLNSVTINYQLDAGSVQTYNWSGSLASASSTTVTLPSISFSGGSHTFTAWTSSPNGNSDNGPSNDDASSSFASASNGVTLTIVLDNYPEETSWQVLDGNTVLAAGGTYGSQPDGSTVIENICLPDGCFDFVINDAYGDGICCAYGSGSYVLRDDSDNSVLASGGSFGSSETTNFCVQSAPSLAALISSSTNVSCNGGSDGSATASASGGATPYSYSWSNGATGATATGLAAGSYTVTVTDGNSDQATATVTITDPTALTYFADQTNLTCNGADNGSAYILVNGGTSPYSYAWSTGETLFTAVDLAPGAYNVTVTDANGCTTGTSFTITEPAALSASAGSSDASCNGSSNGSVSVSANGGTSPYSYSWSNGATSASVSGLSAGTYNVTVTDANGCTASASATVGQPSAISLSNSTVDASCGSATDGSVDLTVSGGTSPYSYAWSNGASTQDLAAVAAGSYSVTVTDANGCTASNSATVGENSTLASSASATGVSCNGGSDGSASVSASGGSAPYTYSWSNGGTTANISGLTAGTYSVTVIDAAGCTSTSSATVGTPSALVASTSSSDISCNGAADGAASVSVSGGTAPYSYAWSNGGSGSSVSGLSAGTYTVSVTDANGCTANGTVSISEPSGLSASASGSDALCNGGNGSVNLSVSGGTTPYSYNWSNGASSANLSSVGAGSYTVTVTDANGCTATASASVSEPSELSASASASDVSCNGGNDGSASGSASGGTPPYSYSWSGGGSGTSVSGLSAGTYTLTVTDANGCTANANVSVGQPGALSLNVSSVDATCETADGSASASVSGGTAPYSYSWSNGGSSSSISGLATGTYSITVTDANGCTANGAATVSEDCGGCTYVTVNSNNFEGGLGIWNDGGSDCALTSNAAYATSGTNAIQLRDNSSTSYTVTDLLDLSAYSELTIDFNFTAISMENGEDFFLQISTNGVNGYSTIGHWISGSDFNNGQFYSESVVYAGAITSTMTIRFMCDASGNSDWVYLDDVVIRGCQSGPIVPTCNDGIQNGDEEGIDCGGSSCQPCATCSDGIQNGDEEGVDCGGSSCSACVTCSDGIKNGDEEGIDCGGSFCAPCNSSCSYATIDSNDLESGWGIWNDGGSDCSISSNSSYATSGTSSLMIRDNSGSSYSRTDILDLSSYDEISLSFNYITSGMSSGEGFWVRYSTNGTSNYNLIGDYQEGADFLNGDNYSETIVISGPFTSNTTFEFRGRGANNGKQVYLDDIVLSGCLRSGATARLADPTSQEQSALEAARAAILSSINLYPNPTEGQLNVEMILSRESDVEFVVIDMTGKTVFTQRANNTEGLNNINFNMNDVPAGIYMMNVITNKEVVTKRFVIQR